MERLTSHILKISPAGNEENKQDKGDGCYGTINWLDAEKERKTTA